MRRAVLLASLTAKARALSAGMGGAAAQQVTLLGQDAAIALDEDLMRTPGFSVDQLMELAGLSVACAVKDAYPDASSVLVVAGPGNNGGDGLVAARHLRHFGVAKVDVVYPKQPKKQLFANLVAQCTEVDAPVSAAPPAPLATYDVVLDAVFGFSFRGAPRPPFDALLEALAATTAPLVSVDTPSGWHVERGPPDAGAVLRPAVLVSLTAPKKCAACFRGRHYVGGRFVPPFIREKYDLRLPPYPGVAQIQELEAWGTGEGQHTRHH